VHLGLWHQQQMQMTLVPPQMAFGLAADGANDELLPWAMEPVRQQAAAVPQVELWQLHQASTQRRQWVQMQVTQVLMGRPQFTHAASSTGPAPHHHQQQWRWLQVR